MGAPVWRLEIFKKLEAETWSNAYLLDDTDITAADAVASSLVDWEAAIHKSNVQLEYYLLSSIAIGDRIFRHVPLNIPGEDPIGSEQWIPLYNTLRMDMATTDSDPARKYYRLPITEGMQQNSIFTPAAVTAFNSAINTILQPIIDLGSIVTNSGKVVVSASTHVAVQMRQLHRKRRRIVP